MGINSAGENSEVSNDESVSRNMWSSLIDHTRHTESVNILASIDATLKEILAEMRRSNGRGGKMMLG